MRELTGSLVRQEIVAPNGVSETVCTSEISIGVVETGVDGVVVAVVVDVVVAPPPPPPPLGLGSTANVRGVELNVTTSPLAGVAAEDVAAAGAEAK